MANSSLDQGLCQFSDVFGLPGEGIHGWRLGPLALADLLLAHAAAYAISTYLQVSFLIVIIILLVSSIFIHRAFCVETPLTKWALGAKGQKTEV